MNRRSGQIVIVFAGVVAIALFLRWYYVVTAMVVNPMRGDAVQYYYYAWNLLNHHVFSMANPGAALVPPDSYRAPGYPLLLAAWMDLVDDFDLWFAAVILTQCVLGALTAGMTVLLARFWLPLGWSVLAGLLAAVWPHSITVTSYLLGETLFGFLALLSMLLYGLMLKRGTWVAAAAAGLCFGLATLVNPTLLPLVLLLPLVAVWRKDATKRLILTFALCASLLPATWEARNARLPASASASQDRALQTLVIGSWPGFTAAWRESAGLEADMARDIPVAERDARMSSGKQTLEAVEKEQQVMQRSPSEGLALLGNRFLASPLIYLKWYLVQKPSSFWGWDIQIGQGEIYIFPTMNSPLENVAALRALVSACHGLNLLLGIAAMIVATIAIIRRRTPATATGPGAGVLNAVGWLILGVTTIHTLLQAEPRYSIPYRSFEIALAVTAVAWLVAGIRDRRKRRVPAADAEINDRRKGNG
jgi:hypothetical protein